ncbi:MAG TPA: 4-vinyl reductase, partial [Candidatus Thermoplasmatota archaeon]|nr:4-vinyl reductase [Candidatus Thermoplasmatota archaeon]
FRVDVGRHIDPRVPESSVCVPLLRGGDVVGVVEVQSVQADAYGEPEAALLRAASATLVPSLEDTGTLRAKVKEQAGRLERADRDHAMARGLVRGLLKRLGEKSGVRPEVLRDIGREMGAGLQARDVADAAAAYEAMGFGRLQLVAVTGARSVFHGHDLLERDLRSSQPTCYFALGFLEGAMGSATQQATLGAELRCQSQGSAHCEFVVAARRAA